MAFRNVAMFCLVMECQLNFILSGYLSVLEMTKTHTWWNKVEGSICKWILSQEIWNPQRIMRKSIAMEESLFVRVNFDSFLRTISRNTYANSK